MADPRFDVYGIGQCALDYLGVVDEYPPPDVKCEFRGLTVQGGGPVATALSALSRWGRRCAFAGVRGDDETGERILAGLEAEGVDASGLVVREGAASQFAFIAAEPGVGRRTIFWLRPTGGGPMPEDLDLATIRSARAVHTDGMYPEASLAACREGKTAGALVSVDAGSMREGMLELARIADVYAASSVFARSLLEGTDDPWEACKAIAAMGPRISVVTMGERGAVAIVEGRGIDVRAYPVEAVDTTGCGDIFHGGLLHGLLEGWPVERSLDFASWAASRVACMLGGRAGIPRAEEYPLSRNPQPPTHNS